MTNKIRQVNPPLWRRLWNACKANPSDAFVDSKEEFQWELAKEISRSNRRQQTREFSLVHLSTPDEMQPSGISPSMIDAFRKRVRISDTIGWHSSNLAVLLPETDRSGAALVANDLVKLGQRHGLQLDSAIYVYPWDDRLISLSNEIADATEPPSGRW